MSPLTEAKSALSFRCDLLDHSLLPQPDALFETLRSV